MLVINAPMTALKKLSIANPGTIAAVSQYVSALMMSRNTPSVTTVIGKVRKMRTGRIKALINPKIKAAAKAAATLDKVTPGTIQSTRNSDKPVMIVLRINVLISITSNLSKHVFSCRYFHVLRM